MMEDKKLRFSWTVPVGDGLLLLCAMLGFTGSFFSLYGGSWITALGRCADNVDLFLICAVLFGLTTLVAWSLPRFRVAAAGGLTALWAAGVLWNRTELTQGMGVTVREITTLFAGRVRWGQVFSFESGLRPAQETAAVQLFLLCLLAGLALLLGWAVVRSRRWWVVLLLTLPPLLPGLLADLYPDWLAFMALAACWCAMLLTSLSRRAAPDCWGKLTLTAFSAAAVTLALITALFPREGYTRPAWALQAQDSLLNLTNRLSGYFSHWNGPFRGTITYVGSAEEADLTHAGPLSYTGRTVLRVTSNRDGWMYLRGSSLAVYEDGVWKDLPDGTYEAYWSGQEPEVSPLYLPSMQEQDSPVYTVTVDNVGSVGTCVYVPYYPLPQDVNESGMLPVEDTYFARRAGQWSHTVTFADRSPRAGFSSAFSSIPAEYSSDDIINRDFFHYYHADRPSGYAGYVYENYLDVPENLRGTLEQYAASAPYVTSYIPPFSSPSFGIYTAGRFASYLGNLCEYDDSTPAAPDGVDPVYYFLTESRRGYCMHYASAVTLMLRAVGVPARYVSGFAAEVYSGRRVAVPDRAAHAWVEVWVDGFGWYPVEVTPDAAFAWARQPDAQETDEPAETTPEPTQEATPAPTETLRPTDASDQPTASLPGSGGNVDRPGQDQPGFDLSALFPVFKGIARVLGAALLIWSVQFAVKRFRTWRMSGADANHSALVCYCYLCRLGRWGGRMDVRAVELAQKARFSQHTLTREELGLLRYLVDRERSRLCVVSQLPRRLVFLYWWGRPRPSVPPADWSPPQSER